MAGPQDPAAAGGDRLRACHADREQVIETLKDAFVHGRLTRDELDARAGRALSARTHADLAALIADIPPGPAAAGPGRPPAPARRPARPRRQAPAWSSRSPPWAPYSSAASSITAAILTGLSTCSSWPCSPC